VSPTHEQSDPNSPTRSEISKASSPDYEALSKEVRRKMEYLRALRFAAQTQKQDSRLMLEEAVNPESAKHSVRYPERAARALFDV